MIGQLPRRRLLLAGLCGLLLTIVCWFAWSQRLQPAKVDQIAALTQRCQSAMLRDVCGVMKGDAPKANQTRLFIAGIGEVDAQAFAQLRAAGDTMCQELAVKCQTDWSGQACRIGKALYPDLTKPP